MDNEIKDVMEKFFNRLVEDKKAEFEDGMRHWMHLISIAYKFGFEMGYEKGYSDSDGPNSEDILPSENVE